jgi:hypothetical protein
MKRRDIKMHEIMRFYKPKIIAYITVFITFISAFILPCNAILFSKIMFVMLNPKDKNYTYWANVYCGLFVVLSFAYGISTFV